eukprot:COSAG05_NODE_24619_length_240_cov_20.198582_1_plen_33_part_01
MLGRIHVRCVCSPDLQLGYLLQVITLEYLIVCL